MGYDVTIYGFKCYTYYYLESRKFREMRSSENRLPEKKNHGLFMDIIPPPGIISMAYRWFFITFPGGFRLRSPSHSTGSRVKIYHLVMTNSSPWKDPPFYS